MTTWAAKPTARRAGPSRPGPAGVGPGGLAGRGRANRGRVGRGPENLKLGPPPGRQDAGPLRSARAISRSTPPASFMRSADNRLMNDVERAWQFLLVLTRGVRRA